MDVCFLYCARSCQQNPYQHYKHFDYNNLQINAYDIVFAHSLSSKINASLSWKINGLTPFLHPLIFL